MTTQDSPLVQEPSPSQGHRLWVGGVLVIAMVSAFVVVGAIGAREAAHDLRVLPFLDQPVEWIRRAGLVSIPWLLAHASYVGWATATTAAAIAVVGLIAARRRAAPLVLLAAAVSLATWGQIFLLQDRVTLGVCLYGCGAAGAVALGMWCPMRRLDGFPPSHSSIPWKWECGFVFLLTIVALFTRIYALTELPHAFDLEMIASILQSRSAYGLHSYLRWGLLDNSGGLIHLLPKMFLFDLFGTSIYTLRLSAVVFGVAAVPLMYWFVRRIAGVGPAVTATLFLITAPEHLFWSRTENTHFAPLAVAALVSASLGRWMIERLSLRSFLAAALWMPVCRLFYASGIVMFLYPIALYGHALLFVRGAWRKAWYVVPLLAGGVALWSLSFSVLHSIGNGWQWQPVDATKVHGAAVWRKDGEFNNADWPELVRLQAASMTENLGAVLQGMAYRVRGFSHWYERADFSLHHNTTINLGLAVISALGLGYLLGQVCDARAFVLLAWITLALLPGLMSNDPADRRIALVFPALHAIGGVFLGAAVRLVRTRAGRPLARMTIGALGVAVASIASASLASHLLLPIGLTWLNGRIRFTQPLFEESETIFHNIEEGIAMGLVFGNIDRFPQSGKMPCLQFVDSKAWLGTALHPDCTFREPLYGMVMPPERIAALRTTYKPERVSFLLQDFPYSRPQIDLLRQLFPAAQVRRYQPAAYEPGSKLVAISTRISDIELLRAPSVRLGSGTSDTPELANKLLEGVKLRRLDTGSEAISSQGIVIDGGIGLEREGWYRFELSPPCREASFTIDQHPAPAVEPQPMAAGVHAFGIALKNTTSCQLPFRVMRQPHNKPEMLPMPPEAFVSPAVVSLSGARAPEVIPFAGYDEGKAFRPISGTPVDFGIDARGYFDVLVRDKNTLQVQRFDPDGRLEAAWQPQLSGETAGALAVAPDGTSALMGERTIQLTDRTGKLIASWRDGSTWTTRLAFWQDDRILKALQYRNAIAVLKRDGQIEQEWSQFAGGPGKFEEPVTVSVGPEGHILVIQTDGQALLFRNAGNEWNPEFLRSFRIDFSALPIGPRTCTFEGQDRIVISDNPATTMLVYNLNGNRLIAANPSRDFRTQGFDEIVSAQSHGNQLFLLDRSGKLMAFLR